MREPLVFLIFGLALILGVPALYVQQRVLQRDDVRGIGVLRSKLDSVRAELVVATSATDSIRLAAAVAQRTVSLQAREFHVAPRQELIDGWWSVTSPWTLLMAPGVGLVLLAARQLRRGTRAPI